MQRNVLAYSRLSKESLSSCRIPVKNKERERERFVRGSEAIVKDLLMRCILYLLFIFFSKLKTIYYAAVSVRLRLGGVGGRVCVCVCVCVCGVYSVVA